MSEFLLYGSYGYAGGMIAEAAVARGLDPVLAGRREEPLAEQAAALDCSFRVVDLEDPAQVAAALDDVPVVLNCAGPFKRSYEPLVEACLTSGTHYLDITGEIGVFQSIAGFDEAATEADVMCMPGVGFDVVVTDCLAARLADRLPDGTSLALGFDWSGRPASGALKTVFEEFAGGGYVRRDGDLQRVPLAHDVRQIDFGNGRTGAITIPWGDVETAYHTTGIPNVAVYLGVPLPLALSLHAGGFVTPLVSPFLRSAPVQSTGKELIDVLFPGPSERARQGVRIPVWGEATTDDGDRVVSRLETPGSHEVTAEAALLVTERVLDGDAPVGYQTPAGAYGQDLVLDIPGVEREDAV